MSLKNLYDIEELGYIINLFIKYNFKGITITIHKIIYTLQVYILYFDVIFRKILVYCAPREEKTWAVHNLFKWVLEPKVRVANKMWAEQFYSRGAYTIFHRTETENTYTFVFLSRERKWHFRPVYGEIVPIFYFLYFIFFLWVYFFYTLSESNFFFLC